MTNERILLGVLLCATLAAIWIFRSRTRATVVRNRRLGILDLSAGRAQAELETDEAVLASLFSQVILSQGGMPPACDVLFIYGEVGADGKIKNSQFGLRELIRDFGAIVVVFASGNPGQHYVSANTTSNYGRANLVLTLNRKECAHPVPLRIILSDEAGYVYASGVGEASSTARISGGEFAGHHFRVRTWAGLFLRINDSSKLMSALGDTSRPNR